MHTPIDYLQDLGAVVALSFKLTELIELQNGTFFSKNVTPLIECVPISSNFLCKGVLARVTGEVRNL